MVGLSLCALLAVAVLAAAVLLDDRRRKVDTGPVDVLRPDPAGAAAVLRELVAAVEDRDEQLAGSLAPEDDDAAVELLRGVARNARLLDLEGVSARYVAEVGTVAEDGSWTGVVALTWRLAGLDPAPARSEVLVAFEPEGERVGIDGFGGAAAAGRRTPLWLQGPLAVVRVADPPVLVAADRSVGTARATAQRVVRGFEVVRRTLPDWRGPAVVEVPRSAAALEENLGVPAGTYAGVAAVTAAVDGSPGRDASVHVHVNPEVSRSLRSAGAQVVMSHELAHLATRAASSTVEPWLLEGFADWVALRQVSLPDSITLGRAIALVRREGVPERLPGPADFDTRSADLQAAYEQAWLACRILAERLGADGLVRLYRRVDAGAPITAELRRAGFTEQALLSAWQGRLRDSAG